MRKPAFLAAAVLVAFAAAVGLTVRAQQAERPTTRGAEDSAEGPVQYVPVTMDRLQLTPGEFDGVNVQVADVFDKRVEHDDIPQTRYLASKGVTRQTHYAFTTHRVLGSNMICFAPRGDEEVEAFFEQPVFPEMPIYLMGEVGRRVNTEEGLATAFFVQRMVRGHTAPPQRGPTRQKPLRVTLEYETTGPRGPIMQKEVFEVPKPGTRMKIQDPYNREKFFYMTFDF